MRAVSIVIALAVLAGTVSAQSDASLAPIGAGPARPGANADGRSLLDEAAALGKSGKLELALAKVREAAVRFPSAEHDCWAALTYFRLGRLTAAQLHLDLSTTRGDDGPAWCAKVGTDVRAELARRAYAAVTVTVEPADAIIVADDVVMIGGRALWLPPGTASITARADGFDADTVRPAVIAGASAPVAVAITLHRHVDAAPAPAPVRVGEPPTGIAPRRLAGWSLVGGGALIAGGGVAFHVLALGAKSNANRVFTDDPAYASEKDRFDRDRALAIGGYAIGGAALAAGVYLLATGGAEHGGVDVAVVPHGALLSMSWELR